MFVKENPDRKKKNQFGEYFFLKSWKQWKDMTEIQDIP